MAQYDGTGRGLYPLLWKSTGIHVFDTLGLGAHLLSLSKGFSVFVYGIRHPEHHYLGSVFSFVELEMLGAECSVFEGQVHQTF